jgi:hypothetical protein
MTDPYDRKYRQRERQYPNGRVQPPRRPLDRIRAQQDRDDTDAHYVPQRGPDSVPVRPHGRQAAAPRRRRVVRLTAAEKFWYIFECIPMGAGYFAKVPVKKALSEVGGCELTAAEQFWYVLMCIGFGAGYFAKVPVKKALAEALTGGSR